jgi:hypothetical protein
MMRLAIILTCPGLCLHLALHWGACRVFKLALFKDPSIGTAEILHEPPGGIVSGIIEGLILPGSQFVLGIATIVSGYLIWHLGMFELLAPVFIWFGLTLVIHGHPTAQDARGLWRRMGRGPWVMGRVAFLVPLLVGLNRRRGIHYLVGGLFAILPAFFI